MAFYEDPSGVSFYRSKDPVQNFRLRITVRRVVLGAAWSSGTPIHGLEEHMRNRQQERSYVFAWQEKVYSENSTLPGIVASAWTERVVDHLRVHNENISAPPNHQTHYLKEACHEKNGVRTTPSGRITVRTQVLSQHEHMTEESQSRFTGKPRRKFVENTTADRGVEHVLEAFRRARQRLLAARGVPSWGAPLDT